MANKKVLIFGGGTGLSFLLKGLKKFPIDITAVITVSDNGKSTGKLRKEFGTPAVGDIRKVIVALSEIDDPIKEMISYRFNTYSDLDGHAVGNLILTSLMDITGSLKESISSLSKLLDVKAAVFPISEDGNLTLVGKSENGKIIEGEEQITHSKEKIIELSYKEEPKVLPEVKNAIKEADLIILSMGSLYTSIIPNIMCEEVRKELKKTKTPIMYLCNIVTQPGETDNFKVSDHIKKINKYLKYKKVNVVIASSSEIDDELAKKYSNEEQKDPVLIDEDEIKKLNVELIAEDLVSIADNTLKHDSLKLSSIIFNYLLRK